MLVYLNQMFNKFFPYMAACMARQREAQYAATEARRRQPLYVRPRLEGLEERIVPDAYQFINGPGPLPGDWTAAANWQDLTNPGHVGVPGATDTADIPAGAGPGCLLNSTTQQTVAGLTVEGILQVNSKLSVTTMSTTGTFNLGTGGELDVLSTADFGGTGTLQGKIDAQGSTVTFDRNSSMALGNGIQLTGSGLYNIFGPVTCNAALSQEATMVLDANNSDKNGSLTGPGSLTDSGEFDWDGGNLGLSGGMDFIASADLKIEGADNKLLSAGTLTNQCNGSEIGGTGTLTINPGATFDNLGNPSCDVSISNIAIFSAMGTPASFINDADGFFNETGSTTISGNFTNYGYLEVGAGADLTLNGGLDGAHVDGTLILDGDLTLEGSVDAPLGFNLDSGSGTLKVGDGSTTSTLTIGSGYEALLSAGHLEVTSTGTLTGAGTLDNNSGVVTLDLGSSTSGLGAYIQTPSGQLHLQAAAFGGNSQIAVTGIASLGGTLYLDLLDGYTPTTGTVFAVVNAGAVEHQFNVTPPNMTPTYGPTSVTLTQN